MQSYDARIASDKKRIAELTSTKDRLTQENLRLSKESGDRLTQIKSLEHTLSDTQA